MDPSGQNSDRRREPRFSIGAQAILRLSDSDETYPALTVNISSSGLLLKLMGACPFEVGDHVVCEVALPNSPNEALATWGVGHVVRVDETRTAIELRSGIFPSDGDSLFDLHAPSKFSNSC